MVKSHLVRILRTCTKKELREIKKWLHSPAHNQREDVIRLFGFFTQDNNLYKDEYLTKEAAFSWIFPKETYDDARMRQVVHFFTRALEDFLIYQEVSHDEIRAKTALVQVYRKRKLDKPFQKIMRTTRGIQGRHPFRNGRYLHNEYSLQQETYLYLSEFKRTDLNLQEMSDALDVTYIADKLRQSCLMLAHQTVYKADYEIGLLAEVLDYVERRGLKDIPAIAIYYYSYRAITDKENEDHFRNLKGEIAQNGHLFPQTEIRDIYLLALNYCIGRMNAGSEAFVREAFELYRHGFEKEILIEQNRISNWTFLNVILIGLKLEEYNWVENFVHQNQKYLEEKHRQSFVNYSLAQLYYEKKDYSTAMKFLIQFDTDEIIVNLRAKNLLLKMYYEQEEFDALESLLESMRNYLVRKKVLGYHKSNFKNIIRLTKKLIKTSPYSPAQKNKLRKEIDEANPLTGDERKWLLTQLEQL